MTGPSAPDELDRSQLEDEGYTVVSLLDRAGVAAVRRHLRTFDLAADHGFFASLAHAHGPRARRFQQDVEATIGSRPGQLVPDSRPFLVSATTKGRRRGGPVLFHHDWTYTDERTDAVVFFWCPLVDVGPRNGGLSVVPGSHRWTTAIRPSREVEITEAFQDELATRAVPLALRAGQAVAFHPGLFHGSGPNRTWRARPAVTIGVAPATARLVHFHERADGGLVGAEVAPPFFTEHPYGTAPDGYPPVEPWDRATVADDLAAALAPSRQT